MLDQLKELLYLHVQHPNVPRRARHRAFLVTNGEIEEETQAAIQALRAGLNRHTAAISLEVISRGHFVKWAIDLEAGLWPQDVDDWRGLLEILGMSGASPLPVDRLILLLDGILGSRVTKTEIRRKASSAAIFTALALRDFALRGNHLAEATASLVSVLCRACARLETTTISTNPLELLGGYVTARSSLARLAGGASLATGDRPLPMVTSTRFVASNALLARTSAPDARNRPRGVPTTHDDRKGSI